MNTTYRTMLAGVLLLLAAGAAHAQSIDDKLRSQLRSTVQELRQLQDNQAQLQADKAAAEKQRDDALAQLKAVQAQLAAARGDTGAEAAAKRALAAERAAREQDARSLAKYKASYDDLLAVSRTRDAQHVQAQQDLAARDTQLKTCEAAQCGAVSRRARDPRRVRACRHRHVLRVAPAVRAVGARQVRRARAKLRRCAVCGQVRRGRTRAGCGARVGGRRIGRVLRRKRWCKCERAVTASRRRPEPIDSLNTGNTDMEHEQTNTADERAAHDAPIEAVSAERLAEILRRAGYRVTVAEQNGAMQLMSASQGVGFAVRFGNPAVGVPPAIDAARIVYLDYTLSCVLQVQGELPAELVANWNRTKRFARLASHGAFLALEMDVVVAGGVSERHLRSTVELWDRLIQEFLLHLRNRPTLAEQEAAARAADADRPDAPAAVAASSGAAVPS